MGMSLGCGVMVGLPYKEMSKYFNDNELRELIWDGLLDVGSIYYDSPYEENIVGIWVKTTSWFAQIDLSLLLEKASTMEILIPQLKNAELKTYLTLRVT